MRMTPSALAVILGSLGYPVTLRRLTDWRAKGLLPPLQRLGLGRGRGVARYWSESDIVQRAIKAYKSLRETRRARSALIALFSTGYDCASDKVCDAYEQNFRRPAFMSPQILHRLAKQIAKTVPRFSHHVDEVVGELFGAFASDGWRPGRRVKSVLLVEFFNRVSCQVSDEKRPPPIKENKLLQLIEGLRATISFVGFGRIVANATDEDWRTAQTSWVEFFSMLDGAVDAIHRLGNAGQSAEPFESRLGELLAPIGIPLILPMPSE